MTRSAFMAAVLLSGCLSACADGSSQTLVSYPLEVHGTLPRTVTTADGYAVTLAVARVGFGPVAFCTTAAASSDLCPAALQEWAAAGEVDALSATATLHGTVTGGSGPVRSVMYDFGISWFSSMKRARLNEGVSLGHSVHLEGTAVRGAESIGFVLDADAITAIQGERAVSGQRVEADVADSKMALAVQIDVNPWMERVKLDEGGAPVVDGRRILATNSSAASAIVTAMTAQVPPVFVWDRDEGGE